MPVIGAILTAIVATILPGRSGAPAIQMEVPGTPVPESSNISEEMPSSECSPTESEASLPDSFSVQKPLTSAPLHFEVKILETEEFKCYMCEKRIQIGECRFTWALFDTPGRGSQLSFHENCFVTWLSQEGLEGQAMIEMGEYEHLAGPGAAKVLIRCLNVLGDIVFPEDSQAD